MNTQFLRHLFFNYLMIEFFRINWGSDIRLRQPHSVYKELHQEAIKTKEYTFWESISYMSFISYVLPFSTILFWVLILFVRFSYFGDQYHRNNLINNTVCAYQLDNSDTWLCNIFRLGRWIFHSTKHHHQTIIFWKVERR